VGVEDPADKSAVQSGVEGSLRGAAAAETAAAVVSRGVAAGREEDSPAAWAGAAEGAVAPGGSVAREAAGRLRIEGVRVVAADALVAAACAAARSPGVGGGQDSRGPGGAASRAEAPAAAEAARCMAAAAQNMAQEAEIKNIVTNDDLGIFQFLTSW
jgi:hypothetical protein